MYIYAVSDAIKFCESHECKECLASTRDDCRTEYMKCVLHAPCWLNLLCPDHPEIQEYREFEEQHKRDGEIPK